MLKLLKSFLSSLVVWYLIVSCGFFGLYVLARRKPTGLEVESGLTFLLGYSVLMLLLIWPICRLFRRLPATLIGASLGLCSMCLVAWIWIEGFQGRNLAWGLSTGATGLWTFGTEVAIPSGIAGGIVGYSVGRQSVPRKS
jgi:hypothetical protein